MMYLSEKLKFGLILVALGLPGCGKKDDKSDPATAAPAATEQITNQINGALSLYDNACVKSADQYLCNHGKIADYFQGSGANPFETAMKTYTFTLPTSGNTWAVTDEGGQAVSSISLEQGKPVKFILKGGETGAVAHYLNEPLLFFNSSVFKVESKDTFSFTGPYVNAIENRLTGSDSGAAGYELAVYFVPMVRGTFTAYCQQSVVNGSDYKLIRSGAVSPNMETGHAGPSPSSMKITIDVTGDKDVAMSAPHATIAEQSQRAAFDNHPWSDNGSKAEINGPNFASSTKASGTHLWLPLKSTSSPSAANGWNGYVSNGSTNSECTSKIDQVVSPSGLTANLTLSGYCKFLVGTDGAFTQYTDFANSASATAVSADSPLKLRTGYATILRFSNAGSSDMTLDVEKLTRTFAIRKFQAKNGEFKVDFAKSITVKPGQWMEIWAVPMVKGNYTLSSSSGTAVNVQVVDTLN